LRKLLVLAATHLAAAGLGFAAGIYVLPILIAPPAPTAAEVKAAASEAQYTTQFRRNLKGSDLLHWGEGTVTLTRRNIALAGKLSPGPDYKLYLAPEFVDTKEGFLRIKERARRIGDVKTFDGFILPVPDSVDLAKFDTVVVWCETFSMFISAGKYR
jgi:hypothetical protein